MRFLLCIMVTSYMVTALMARVHANLLYNPDPHRAVSGEFGSLVDVVVIWWQMRERTAQGLAVTTLVCSLLLTRLLRMLRRPS